MLRSWYLAVLGLSLVATLFAMCGDPPPARRTAAVSVDAVLPGPCPGQEEVPARPDTGAEVEPQCLSLVPVAIR